MKYLSILLLISLLCCTSEDLPTNDSIIGRWHDKYNYPTEESINGELVEKFYPNIIYELLADNTYNTYDEKDWVMPKTGTWSVNSDTTKIYFTPKPSYLDSLNGYKIMYDWSISSLSEKHLQVIHKVEGISDSIPILVEFQRTFERIK